MIVDWRLLYMVLDGVLAAVFLISGAWATLQALIFYSTWLKARSSQKSARSLPLRDRWRHAWIAAAVASLCYATFAGWSIVLVFRAVDDPGHSTTRKGLLFLAGGLGCLALCGVLFLLPGRFRGGQAQSGGA